VNQLWTSEPTVEPTAEPTVAPTAEPTPTTQPIPAAAPEGPTIMVSTHTVAQGDTIVVTLLGFELPGVGTATVEVNFDPAILELVQCSKDPNGVFDLVQCNPDFEEGALRFNVTSLTGVNGDITIAEITFKAIGQNGETSPVEVIVPTISNVLGAPIEVIIVEGSVAISDQRSGDVNCDGRWNAVDAMFMLQHDVGLRAGSVTCTQPQRNATILYIEGCDVNDDGVCGPVDALFSLQCDVGLSNSACPKGQARSGEQVWVRFIDNAFPDGIDEASGLLSTDIIPAGASGTINVAVKLERAADVGAATIEVHYDDSLLKLAGCTMNPDKNFDNGVCNENYSETGVIPFNVLSLEGFSGDAILADLQFEVIGSISQAFVPKLKINRSVVDINGTEIPVSVAEINQIGSDATILEDVLRVFLPIILK